MNTVSILYDDLVLWVVPSFPELEKALSAEVKTIEEIDPGPSDNLGAYKKRKTRVRKRLTKFFTEIGHKPRAIQAPAGFLNRVVMTCLDNGYIPDIVDNRLEFPRPKLHLMTGFRFSQRELITEALIKDCSGIVEAPTRFGKTTLLINTLRAYPGLCTVVTVPGADLLKQLYEDIKEKLPHREVKMIGGGSKVKYPSEDITVCSMDSLHKCEHGRVRLLLIDEPHACVSDSRAPELAKFDLARKIAYGATPGGRFDNKDLLIEGMIGPVLARRTYREAVEEGAICRLAVIMLKVRYSGRYGRDDRTKAYNDLLLRNDGIHDIIKLISDEIIPKDWQTIVFIKNEKQAKDLEKKLEEPSIAMAKVLTKKERKELVERMENNDIKRCLASDIFSQGVTFHDIRSIIVAGGGGGSISCIQKPGRLAEIRPGKDVGVFFDFLFENEQEPNVIRRNQGAEICLEIDSKARYNTYLSKGYEVYVVDTEEELRSTFSELYNGERLHAVGDCRGAADPKGLQAP